MEAQRFKCETNSKKFTQTKFLEITLKRSGGMSHRLHIEHSVGQGLLAFLSQSWHCLYPREGAKFIQIKFHGTCLDEETDFNRSQVTDILRNILVMRLTTDPRILLFNL